MAGLYEKIRGVVRVEVCGALPESVLNACAAEALLVWDMEHADRYTLRFCVFEKQLERLRGICGRCMCEMRSVSLSGGSKGRKMLLRRKAFALAILLTAALLLASSLFIWEIDIKGAEKLSRGEILRALSECGVESGSFWPAISSDLVRSRMTGLLPELAWMTVNVNGSRATVLILEREEKPEIYAESDASYMIAKKTGIVSRISVLSGRPLVSEGACVLEGETLVTGHMESLSNGTRTVCSRGEVIAHTWPELTAVSPLEMDYKTGESRSYSRFALKIGKNRINFYLRGRNDIDECDKIVYEYNLGIDGLFALPLSIIREEISKPERVTAQRDSTQQMQSFLSEYLKENTDGEILSAAFSGSCGDGLRYLTLRAHCLEDIALNIPMTQAAVP